jgi:hypothetical protein
VGIDHPSLFLYFRSIDVAKDSRFKSGGRPWQESAFFALWARVVGRAWWWNVILKITRPVINHLRRQSAVPKTKRPLNEWLKARDLPRVPQKTFREKWKQ